MVSGIKLVAFDLDGVLVDGGGSWIQVHKGLGTYEKSRKNSLEYFSGRITFEEWAHRDVKLWHGTSIDDLKKILYSSELMPGIDETLGALKKRYKLAIISGGLKILAERLADKYDMDYVYGNELLVSEGRITGISHTVDFDSKGKILEEIAADLGIDCKQCAAVGDYLNDIPMFKVAGFSVAFNPKNDEVAESADKVVYEKDLRKLLDYF